MEFVVKFVSKQVRNFLYFPARSGSDFLAPHPPTVSSALATHCPFSSRSLSGPGLFASGASDRLLAGFWQTPLLHVFFPAVHGEQKRRRPQGSSRIFREQASGTCALQKKGGQESGSVHFPCALHKTLSNSERSERSRVLGPAVSPRVRHPGQLSRAGLSTQRSPLRDSTQPVTVTISARVRLSMRCFSLSLRATRKTSRAI